MTLAGTDRVLVVEDDVKIAKLLLDYLKSAGYVGKSVGDGHAALRQIQDDPPDLVILDWMLPGMDGIEVCREVRRTSEVPILLLTARIDEVDRLLGLDTGADDYVCKPFSPREVMARVRALLRRTRGNTPVVPHPWLLDETSFRIAWRGQWLPLTRQEFLMFRMLLSRPGRVYSRAQLMDAACDESRDVSDRTIDSHIKNLRRKLQSVESGCDCITSVYGVGYRFDTPPRAELADQL